MNKSVQYIEGYVEWNQGYQEFSFESMRNAYEEISKLLHTPDIVIISDKKLCSQFDTFGEIKKKVGNENKLILNTMKISDILNLQGEINRLKQKIEVIEKMHQFEIDELQSKLTSLEQDLIKQKLTHDFVESKPLKGDLQVTKLFEESLQSTKEDNFIEQSMTFEQSLAFEQSYACHFCNMDIEQETIQLCCFHCFHDRCFGDLLQGQIIRGCVSFSCLCGIKIKPIELYSLSNQFAANIYQLQIQHNQLQRLQDTNKNLRKCPMNNCLFFYYYDKKLPDSNYCPLCLE